MAISTYLSIITLNVNGLNTPIERHKVADWIKKKEPAICCRKESHFRMMDTQNESERVEKVFHEDGNNRKDGEAILISDKIDFKTKTIKKDKEGHYIMIKGSIHEDVTLIDIYTPDIGAPNYIKQTLTDIKGETDNNTMIVGDFNTPQISMDRSSRQKISKATEVLNDTVYLLDLIDIYRTSHPKTNNTHSFQVCREAWNVLQDGSHSRSQNKPQ